MAQVIASFFIDPIKNEFRSTQESRDIYDDVECIRIFVAGSRDEVARIATDEDKRRFAAEYKRFKDAQTAPVEGTPLSEWPQASGSFVREAAYFNIKTVEQLAGIDDQTIGRLGMGAREKVTQAQVWLAKAGKDVEDGEKQAMRQQIADMQAQIAKMQGGDKTATVKAKRAPRKSKAAAEAA